MLAQVEAEAFSDIILIVAKPISVTIQDPPKGNENKAKVIENKRRLCLQLWNKHYSQDFQQFITTCELDKAHGIWREALEHYLSMPPAGKG